MNIRIRGVTEKKVINRLFNLEKKHEVRKKKIALTVKKKGKHGKKLHHNWSPLNRGER